jgi:hypothetical protein
MAVGISTVNLANTWLDMLRAVAFTAPAAQWVKLHISDPGSAGANGAAAVTTRSQLTFAAASGGALALTSTLPSWSMTTTETISHISVWSASSAGTFYYSAALTVSKAVVNGDTLTLNTLGFSFTPLAA